MKTEADLLKTRIRKEECQGGRDEEDWMLAAAVLDRICAFAFAVILVRRWNC